jgi:polysaccharide biosynthesis/export protein
VTFFSTFLSGRMKASVLALAGTVLWAVLWAMPATAQTDPFSTTGDWGAPRGPFPAATPSTPAQATDRTPALRGPGAAQTAQLPGRTFDQTGVDGASAALGTAPGAGPGTTPGALPTASRPFDRTVVDPDFRLGPGDVLLINVLEDPTLDTEALVRPDGLITVPLAGTIMAAGRTPEEVAAAIRQQLAPEFVEPPTVSVVLRAVAPTQEQYLSIYVIGEVNNPGLIPVQQPIGILQALALAGGVGVFGDAENIQVRQVDEWGVEKVLLVNYELIEKGGIVHKIVLDDGDTILVPERGLFDF